MKIKRGINDEISQISLPYGFFSLLLDYLKEKQIKHLVVCGMMTHMCVEAAVRAGADFGFQITLIHDACATRNLRFDDKEIPAETVHLSTLAVLNRVYARVISTKEFLSSHF